MKLGYSLNGNASNDGIFFDGSVPRGVLCPSCGSCLDYEYAPAKIKIHPSKKYDVSYSHDTRHLFSKRFVTYCSEVLGSLESFKKIDANSTELYYMNPQQIVQFDVERSKTRFVKPCALCGGYESIVGAVPSYLQQQTALGPGFYRSHLAFGSAQSKSPIFFVSVEWGDLLASQKFRGLYLREIF
jgi:hypothetical protein